jgi:hypothetical protein
MTVAVSTTQMEGVMEAVVVRFVVLAAVILLQAAHAIALLI